MAKPLTNRPVVGLTMYGNLLIDPSPRINNLVAKIRHFFTKEGRPKAPEILLRLRRLVPSWDTATIVNNSRSCSSHNNLAPPRPCMTQTIFGPGTNRNGTPCWSDNPAMPKMTVVVVHHWMWCILFRSRFCVFPLLVRDS